MTTADVSYSLLAQRSATDFDKLLYAHRINSLPPYHFQIFLEIFTRRQSQMSYCSV